VLSDFVSWSTGLHGYGQPKGRNCDCKEREEPTDEIRLHDASVCDWIIGAG
jgi:hypothetical protein